MNKYGRIFVVSHCGMVGSAILRRQQTGGCGNLLFRMQTDSAAVACPLQGEMRAAQGKVPR